MQDTEKRYLTGSDVVVALGNLAKASKEYLDSIETAWWPALSGCYQMLLRDAQARTGYRILWTDEEIDVLSKQEAREMKLDPQYGTSIETKYTHWLRDAYGQYHVLSVHDHNGCATCKECKEHPAPR